MDSLPVNEAIFEQVKHLAGVAPEITGACLILHFENAGDGRVSGESCNVNVKPDTDVTQMEFIDKSIDLLSRLREQMIEQRERQIAEGG